MESFALITGASSGIGERYAHRLAQQGWNIVVVSNRSVENEWVAAALRKGYGVKVLTLAIDLSRIDAAEMIHRQVGEWGIRVDLLINNAGMLLFGQLAKTSPEALDRIVALHCTTPTKLCRLFGTEMAQRGRGHILLMSSVTAWTPYPTISHYAATKAYLKSFGQALWYELRKAGVGVTTVFPSAVDTPLYTLDASLRRRLLRWGVMLTADEVARRALKALFAGRRRCLPGWLTKVEAALCWLMPARALLPILKLPAVRRILDRV